MIGLLVNSGEWREEKMRGRRDRGTVRKNGKDRRDRKSL